MTSPHYSPAFHPRPIVLREIKIPRVVFKCNACGKEWRFHRAKCVCRSPALLRATMVLYP